MAENGRIRAPAGLSTRARRLFREIVDGWALDADQVAVLEAGCRALTRLEAAEAVVAEDGLTVDGSKGQPRPHPLLSTIDVERRAFVQALKQLDLARHQPAKPQPRDGRGMWSSGHVIPLYPSKEA